MNFARKPSSLRTGTHFTKEEVIPTGCCFSLFPQPKTQQIPVPLQRCSSETKIKKIDLVIAKRGHTQEKERNRQSREFRAKRTFSTTELKYLESTTGHSSLTSKLSTQKNSLKNSRTKLSIEGKSETLTLGTRYQKYLTVCNSEWINRPMEVTFNQTRTDIANGSIQMLSEISMVEEEFISHESNTLKALNLLSNQSERKSIEKQSTLSRHKMQTIPEGRYEDSRDVRNPLSRLLEKKGISRQEYERPRLHL